MSRHGGFAQLPPSYYGQVRLFKPTRPLPPIVDMLAECAWKGDGVRLFRFDDGMWAVVTVGKPGDEAMMRHCSDYLFATYTRGALWTQIAADMRWAGVVAAA